MCPQRESVGLAVTPEKEERTPGGQGGGRARRGGCLRPCLRRASGRGVHRMRTGLTRGLPPPVAAAARAAAAAKAACESNRAECWKKPPTCSEPTLDFTRVGMLVRKWQTQLAQRSAAV